MPESSDIFCSALVAALAPADSRCRLGIPADKWEKKSSSDRGEFSWTLCSHHKLVLKGIDDSGAFLATLGGNVQSFLCFFLAEKSLEHDTDLGGPQVFFSCWVLFGVPTESAWGLSVHAPHEKFRKRA
jgi:hypothetical protein